MKTDDIHSLTGAYALDAVDDVERASFEAHLAGCSLCRTEVASLRAAAGELSTMTLMAPPPSLRATVLREIKTVRPLPPLLVPEQSTAPESTESREPAAPLASRSDLAAPTTAVPSAPSTPAAPSPPDALERKREERARRAPRRQWLIGVAAAAVLATGGVVWSPWTPETSTVQLTATQQVLQANDAQRFEKKVGDATATIVRSPSLKKAVIVTADMPAAPEGKVYEVWLQQGAEMVRAGLMPAGPSNTVLLDGDAASAHGVGITVEPAGGSETPTSAPVAVIEFA